LGEIVMLFEGRDDCWVQEVHRAEMYTELVGEMHTLHLDHGHGCCAFERCAGLSMGGGLHLAVQELQFS
jgi:hypothetical protein